MSHSSFDFSGYSPPNSEFIVLEASRQCLRLHRKREGRTYELTGSRGEFTLSYFSEVDQAWHFVLRTDDLYRMFRALGLKPHASKHEAAILTRLNQPSMFRSRPTSAAT